MQRFKDYYQMLREGVTYKMPTGEGAAPYVMADFYMLNYLRTTDIDLLAQHKRGGAIRAHDHMDDLLYAEKQILPTLKKELLSSVFFALCAEIRHIFDENDGSSGQPDFDDTVGLPLNTFKIYSFFGDYRENYDYSNPNTNNSERYGKEQFGYFRSYEAIEITRQDHNLTRHQTVRLFEEAYSKANWNDGYGGEAWANIARGWMRLNTAKTKDEIYVAIDHVYDLQHNTDSVFNKLKKYYISERGGYRWIKEALDLKASILSMQELVPHLSGSMKKLARPFLQAIGDGPKKEENPNYRVEDWFNGLRGFLAQTLLDNFGIARYQELTSNQTVYKADVKLLREDKTRDQDSVDVEKVTHTLTLHNGLINYKLTTYLEDDSFETEYSVDVVKGGIIVVYRGYEADIPNDRLKFKPDNTPIQSQCERLMAGLWDMFYNNIPKGFKLLEYLVPNL